MAENYIHIDKIIRQKFENFEPEPPIQVWENIKSGINKTPPPTASSGITLPIIIAISLLIFISGLLHHYYNDNTNNLKAKSSTLSIQSAGVISTGSTTVSDPALQEAFYQMPAEMPAIHDAVANTIQVQPAAIPVRAPFEQNLPGKGNKKAGKKDTSTKLGNSTRTGQWKPGLVQAIAAGELSYADAVKFNLSPRDIRKLSGFKDYSKKNFTDLSISAYFNPEVTSCQDASIENTISYNFGIMPRLSFNRFFLQSGINMRFTKDKGNYAVDYNRFLGTYEDVYLVTFDSTETGEIIPTYHTNTVKVYDTINHYSVTQTKANYTYLEIPLFFGYRYTFGKFSLFAKAGPAASFLIFKDVPEAVIPEDEAQIINIDKQIPVRMTVNWQLLMGAGFDYQLADKLSFSLEPTFRCALKPEFKMPAGGKGNSTSFGIRAGLNYNF